MTERISLNEARWMLQKHKLATFIKFHKRTKNLCISHYGAPDPIIRIEVSIDDTVLKSSILDVLNLVEASDGQSV